MPFSIIRNDIIKIKVDAIVNSANEKLQKGGGVCGAIFAAAGDGLEMECNKIGYCSTGEAVITNGYNLPSKYIIHTPGPVWKDGSSKEIGLLYNSYMNSMKLAQEYNCETIAFPLILSGIYGFPKDIALTTAMSAINDFLRNNELIIYLVIYDAEDAESFSISNSKYRNIKRYIDDNYVIKHSFKRLRKESHINEFHYAAPTPISSTPRSSVIKTKRKLDELVSQLDETFSQMLLRLIDEKGLTDVQTYKKANIDRRLFSKIRSNTNYKPSKNTTISFAIALNLNIDETLDLLCKAGYTLSNSSKFDVIIKYFIEDKNYNIYEINEALFVFEQALLGA